MAKGDVLGHMNCPLCNEVSEVKEDKAGHPMFFCREGCRLQLFTRNEMQVAAMLQKLRPVASPAPVTPDPAPEKPKSFFETITGIPA